MGHEALETTEAGRPEPVAKRKRVWTVGLPAIASLILHLMMFGAMIWPGPKTPARQVQDMNAIWLSPFYPADEPQSHYRSGADEKKTAGKRLSGGKAARGATKSLQPAGQRPRGADRAPTVGLRDYDAELLSPQGRGKGRRVSRSTRATHRDSRPLARHRPNGSGVQAGVAVGAQQGVREDSLAVARAQRVDIAREMREASLRLAQAEKQQRERERQELHAAEEARKRVEVMRNIREEAMRLALSEKQQRERKEHERAPAVRGDLKLVLQSDQNLRVFATFVSYPLKKRGRVLTKREAKQARKLAPLTVRALNGTIESVIDMAKEGIYTFVVEPADGGRHDARVGLVFHQGDGEASPKSLGRKAIAGKTVVARVLMPDGVVWSDDSAFSGSIQDSEGITKFNAKTGLVWKEYF